MKVRLIADYNRLTPPHWLGLPDHDYFADWEFESIRVDGSFIGYQVVDGAGYATKVSTYSDDPPDTAKVITSTYDPHITTVLGGDAITVVASTTVETGGDSEALPVVTTYADPITYAAGWAAHRADWAGALDWGNPPSEVYDLEVAKYGQNPNNGASWGVYVRYRLARPVDKQTGYYKVTWDEVFVPYDTSEDEVLLVSREWEPGAAETVSGWYEVDIPTGLGEVEIRNETVANWTSRFGTKPSDL
jgi:hypothetical protein